MANGKLAFLKTRFYFSKIFLGAMFLGLFFGVLPMVARADAVTGYAWSDTIGWIQFNPSNVNTGNNYGGVLYDRDTGKLSGYAWSDNIGWIKFDGLSAYPDSNRGQEAKSDTLATTRNFSGWARACAGTISGNCTSMTPRSDGWDGWISLDNGSVNPNYGAYIDYSTTGDFRGYAWGSDVVGWIKFNCIDTPGECSRSNYKVTIGPVNDPPGYHINVTVNNNNNAQGYVTAPDTSTTDINCGYGTINNCNRKYPFPQNLILKASTTNSLTTDSFVSWSGVSCAEGNNTGDKCTVRIDTSNLDVTATFNNGDGGCNLNNVQDNGETGIDCGGGGCPSCGGGGGTCSDGIQNQNETGIDTGGVCGSGGAVCGNSAVESGETCDDGNTISGDGCSSSCQTESTCSDGIQNQNETGIDTGGVCVGGNPPTVPTGLSASTGLCETGTIALRWNTVNGAAYYKILKDNPRNDSEVNQDVIRIDGGGTSSYSDENLGVSETHNYKIRACASSDNCSAYSSGIDAQSPAMCKNLSTVTCPTSDWKAPENFMATKGNCGENGAIVLTWNDASDEDYYEIYRATSFMFSDVVSIASPGKNTTFYNDRNDAKNAGQRYYYAIRACKSDGACSNYNYYDAEAPALQCDNSAEGQKNLRISVVGGGAGQIRDNWTMETWTASQGVRNISGSNYCDKNDTNSTGCDVAYNYYNNASRYQLTTINNWTMSPSSGSKWDGWLYGSCAGGSCAMSQDHVAIGRFDSDSYSKITVCEAATNGTCGSATGGSYENPPRTNLCSSGTASAVTDGGAAWNWTCGGSGGGTNASCSAAKINRVALSVTKSGNGSGTITSNPSGLINCGSDCSESFDDDSGAVVTLKAAATGNSAFTGWSGVSCGEGNNNGDACTVTMRSADISVNAAFQTGFSVTPLNSAILATIVENLSADSSEATLAFSGQSDGNINLTASFDRPRGDAEFSEDNGQSWKNSGNLNFQLSDSRDIKFRVRNIPGSTVAGTYPITITARDNGGNAQTATINLQVEKITTEWREI